MRLSDAMRPALDWSEAAMLPAQVRTLSGGAALRMLPTRSQLATAQIAEETEKPAPAQDATRGRMRALRRAAYRQVRGVSGQRSE